MEEEPPYMPRTWRWVGVKQVMNNTLVSMIEAEEDFTFGPYAHTPLETIPLRLFADHNQEIDLSWQNLKHLIITMATRVAPTMLQNGIRRGRISLQPLESPKAIGLPPGGLTISGNSESHLATEAEARFIGNGKNSILEGHYKLFWASAKRIDVRLLGRVLLQEWCIERMQLFSHNIDKIPLEVVLVPMIFIKYPHMRLKKRKLGPLPLWI